MLGSVFGKSIRDLRRGLFWWSIGLVGLVALLISVYPSVRDNPGLNNLVQDYPEALKAFIAFGGAVDYVSGAGYLGSELFSFMVPLLFAVAAIGAGASAIAGEEERGTLELLLAHPVSRRRLATEKIAAAVTEVGVLTVVLWVALWVGVATIGMEISGWKLLSASVSAGALGLTFGAAAFLVGAATGRRALAIGAAAAFAVASYLVNALAVLVTGLEPFQKLSPFYHYAVGDPLRQGIAPTHLLLLLGGAAIAAAIGVAAFDRRDVHAP